jgi:starch synthase
MACAKPVVASDFGGFREVVDDGVTGYLARPQDPLDLADKINLVLSDPKWAAAMGQAGREKVLAMFSWAAVANRLEEVYKCLVHSST